MPMFDYPSNDDTYKAFIDSHYMYIKDSKKCLLNHSLSISAIIAFLAIPYWHMYNGVASKSECFLYGMSSYYLLQIIIKFILELQFYLSAKKSKKSYMKMLKEEEDKYRE